MSTHSRSKVGREPLSFLSIGVLVATAAIMLGCHSSSATATRAPTAPPSAATPAGSPSRASEVVATTPGTERVVRIEAKRFEYSPASITLEKGVPVVLELVSLDRVHGFSAPDLGLRSDIKPEAPTRLRIVPEKAGTFEFHCDVFCGGGHEDMTGEIIVRE